MASPCATGIVRLAIPPRPSHPAPNVRDDRETPLLEERGTGELVDLICPSAQAEYFWQRRWTKCPDAGQELADLPVGQTPAKHMRPRRYFFTSGHSLDASGLAASSDAIVAISL
jgi:hypothetical protein